MKEQIKKEILGIEQDLWSMGDHLYHHPELGDQEYKSMGLLSNYLERHDFQVEKGILYV